MISSSLGRRGCSSLVSLYVVSIPRQLMSITRWLLHAPTPTQTTFFATMEAQLLGFVIPVEGHVVSTLLLSANAILSGAFAIHISAGTFAPQYPSRATALIVLVVRSHTFVSHFVLSYHFSPEEGYGGRTAF